MSRWKRRMMILLVDILDTVWRMEKMMELEMDKEGDKE